MHLNAVLFDLDGTLIETHIDFHAMMERIRAFAQSSDVPESLWKGQDVLGIVETATTVITERGEDGLAFHTQAFAALEELEIIGCSHPSLLPGAEKLLEGLQAKGVKIGIVTRNCRQVSAALLAQFSLPCDVLLTRDDVAHTKPNPQHLWDALDVLGCSAQQAAMVGDHWMDIQAGRRASVACTVGVLNSRQPEWFAPCPPDLLAKDLIEADQMLQRQSM